jgi:hypothetical protein
VSQKGATIVAANAEKEEGLSIITGEKIHIPPSLVVDRGSSYVEDCSALDFPFIHDAWPYDLTQNKLSNINWLKFYH